MDSEESSANAVSANIAMVTRSAVSYAHAPFDRAIVLGSDLLTLVRSSPHPCELMNGEHVVVT